MKALEMVNFIITILFTVCYMYQFLYVPVVWLFRRKKKVVEPVIHDYAVLICARNEERVVGGLIDSLKSQTYPSEHIKIFVMADNCTDDTAAVARNAGAYVYERQNKELVGKGYALQVLLENIEKDHGAFDGYFIFDADNILEPDYIEQMNLTHCSGYDIITSYRNSRNYGGNWISAGYALWFLRESKYLNCARWTLGTSCAVSGTGFMFSRRIFEKIGGWNYHLLTEDIEFSIAQIIDGEKIGFCSDAVLYDEQPTGFKQSWRQRMRWSKGYLQVLFKYGRKLFRGIFRGKFACYDMTMSIMPAFVFSIVGVICNVSASIIGIVRGDNLMVGLISFAQLVVGAYMTLFVLGAITTVTEWKRIRTSTFKKIFYMFTFPFFMFTYVPIAFVSLFAKVTWKPIEHGLSDAGMTIKAGYGKRPEKS